MATAKLRLGEADLAVEDLDNSMGQIRVIKIFTCYFCNFESPKRDSVKAHFFKSHQFGGNNCVFCLGHGQDGVPAAADEDDDDFDMDDEADEDDEDFQPRPYAANLAPQDWPKVKMEESMFGLTGEVVDDVKKAGIKQEPHEDLSQVSEDDNDNNGGNESSGGSHYEPTADCPIPKRKKYRKAFEGISQSRTCHICDDDSEEFDTVLQLANHLRKVHDERGEIHQILDSL
jgi:hypothetical protein